MSNEYSGWAVGEDRDGRLHAGFIYHIQNRRRRISLECEVHHKKCYALPDATQFIYTPDSVCTTQSAITKGSEQ